MFTIHVTGFMGYENVIFVATFDIAITEKTRMGLLRIGDLIFGIMFLVILLISADYYISNHYTLLAVNRRLHTKTSTNTVSGNPWNIRITMEGGSQT